MIPDGETIKIKVVDLEKLWNFVVDNFFQLRSFTTWKYCLKLKFEIVEELWFLFLIFG